MTTPTVTSAPKFSGPKGRLLTGHIEAYAADPLGFMLAAREYGDVVPIRFGPLRGYLGFGPAVVEELLVTRNRDFRKSLGVRMLMPLVGRGLLTAEGDQWLRQRRLAAPAFHRQQIDAYGARMVDYAREHALGWQSGQELDLHAELMALTLRIVARVLFDSDVTVRIADIARANEQVQAHLIDRFGSLRFLLPHWVPTPGNLRYRRTIRELDEVVFAIIRERRAEGRAGPDHGDLLGMLLAARDEDGSSLSERQVRDEVMTLLLAGHETTAVALGWLWMLLDAHPAVEERLRSELTEVLGERSVTVADVPSLPYTEAVIYETMRLYPPAYVLGREALHDTEVGGVRVRRREPVLISPYAAGRDPRYFEQPDDFRPERWLDGLAKRLPRGVFFPFSFGPRMCIGASFAMLEATLLVASIARDWRFRVLPGQDLRPQPAVTLRPKAGLRVVAESAA